MVRSSVDLRTPDRPNESRQRRIVQVSAAAWIHAAPMRSWPHRKSSWRAVLRLLQWPAVHGTNNSTRHQRSAADGRSQARVIPKLSTASVDILRPALTAARFRSKHVAADMVCFCQIVYRCRGKRARGVHEASHSGRCDRIATGRCRAGIEPLRVMVVGPAGFEPATKGFTSSRRFRRAWTISSPATSREGAGCSSLSSRALGSSTQPSGSLCTLRRCIAVLAQDCHRSCDRKVPLNSSRPLRGFHREGTISMSPLH